MKNGRHPRVVHLWSARARGRVSTGAWGRPVPSSPSCARVHGVVAQLMPARGRPRSRGHVQLLTFSLVLALVRSPPPLMAILSLPLRLGLKRAPGCSPSPFPHLLELARASISSLSPQIARTTQSPFLAEGAPASPERHRGSVAPILLSCALCTILSLSPDSIFGWFHRSLLNLDFGS